MQPQLVINWIPAWIVQKQPLQGDSSTLELPRGAGAGGGGSGGRRVGGGAGLFRYCLEIVQITEVPGDCISHLWHSYSQQKENRDAEGTGELIFIQELDEIRKL